MRLLITGATGLLGQDVLSAAGPAGHDTVALSRGELDITDFASVERAVSEAAPDVVINCAAWTDVDGAESEFDSALAVNGPGAGNVARAASAAGAWTIHISSDYVFDGAKREPYVESDAARPLSAYGRSKLAGELEVALEAPHRHTVVRSAWLFGAGGPCFPATILHLAAERDELTVVEDQVGSPTFAGHLAKALVDLAVSEPRPVGLVHLSGSGACSWYELARTLVEARGLHCEIRAGRSEDLGRPASRPAYSVLGTERGTEVPALPDWREGLADYLLSAGVPTA
jgi:dTDP-4-dehydrorhamnose reductase